MSLKDRRIYQEACIRCSQCKFVPMPESRAFSSICPSIDYGQFNAYSGGGKVITSYALVEGKAAVTPRLVDSVYACTMCGACDTACKTNEGDNVEPMDTLYELRAELAAGGHVPQAQLDVLARLRREGTHLGRREERSRWAEGQAVKNATAEPVKVLLHVGDSNAYDEKMWPQLRTLVRLLKAADVDFGIAYNAETNTGGLAYDLGFQDDARQLALGQAELLRQSGASVLLSACAESYAAFRNLYPRMGVSLGDVRAVHVTEFLEELIRDGRLLLTMAEDATVTYHDPCRLGRLSEPFQAWDGKWITVLNTMVVPDPPRPPRFGNRGNYESPRNLLGLVQGLKLVEMERNRLFSYCCGAGAATAEAYPDMAEMAALNRLREAQATGASCLVTACAGCQRHLADAAAKHAFPIEVVGLLELLAKAERSQDQAVVGECI